jgi:hypothetical protein
VAIVWKQVVGGQAQLPLLFTSHIADGLPMAYDTVDLGGVYDADVAMAPGKVYVVWEDDMTGAVGFRSGTYVSPPSDIQTVSGRGLQVRPNPSTDGWTVAGDVHAWHFTLVDVAGRHVSTTMRMESNDLRIDGTALPPGVYVLQCRRGVEQCGIRLVRY